MKRYITLLGLLFAASAFAGGYVGDYAPGDTVDCNFGTVRPSTGASYTLAGTPVVSIYKDNGTTEITAGVTLTADFDARTGLNHLRVVTTDAAYTPGSNYEAVITTGTVDSVSVVGQPVCSFSLRKVNAGQDARGTLSGTHSSTTADLGTNAPGSTSQLAGMTLVIPARHFAAVITSYDTGTGVATFAPSTALTLTNGDYWELWPTPSGTITGTQTFDIVGDITGSLSGSVGSVTGNVGGTVNGLTSTAQGNVRTALGLSSANLDTQLSGLSSATAVIDGIVDQLLIGVNISKINGKTLTGDGSANPFDVVP